MTRSKKRPMPRRFCLACLYDMDGRRNELCARCEEIHLFGAKKSVAAAYDGTAASLFSNKRLTKEQVIRRLHPAMSAANAILLARALEKLDAIDART